jgi:YYY domain-containing protein
MHIFSLEWLSWLITLELLGLAALPITVLCFKSLPDAGYGLARIVGLLLLGFLNWWLGSSVGLANEPVLLWLGTMVLAGAGVVFIRRHAGPEIRTRRVTIAQIAVPEEAIFLIAFVAWSFVRAINPDVHDAEHPMDYMLLQASGASHTFPPPDHWLAGYSVNYYYLGYTLFALLGRMAQVAPRLGYNLSNVTIFALGCTAAYTLAVALTKDRRWGPAGAFSVMLAGNLQGLGQVLAQFKQGAPHTGGISLWCSTRVIGGGCNSYTAITEFPLFSVIWNDLHPHLMALPFALLAIALAVQALLEPPGIQPYPGHAMLRWGLTVVALGALFPLNSWDYPTYTTLVLVATLLGLARRGALSPRTVLASVAVAPASLLVFAPYYLTVHNATAIGFQANATPLNQVLAVIGSLLIPSGLFLLWQGWNAFHDASPTRRWATARRMIPVLVLLLLLAAPPRTDLLYLALLALGVMALVRRTRSAEPEMLIAILLATTAVLVLLTGDFIYIRDPSDHTPSYRLNTLFKLYYQAWLLLGVVTPFAVLRIWQTLARRTWRFPFRLWATATVVLALGLATYPVEGVASQTRSLAGAPGLDGLLYVRATDPPEYAAITWVLDHTDPAAVIAEGYGSQYWGSGTVNSPNELTTLTGRQSILAWPDGHETLWRDGFGPSPAALAMRRMLEQRAMDLTALYLSPSIAVAQQIMRRYHIAYVFIGPYEWQMFAAEPATEQIGFAKFHRFLRTVLAVPGPTPHSGTTLYAVSPAMDR